MRSLVSFAAAFALLPCTQALWPQPAQFTNGSSLVWIKPGLTFDCQGFGDLTAAPGKFDRRTNLKRAPLTPAGHTAKHPLLIGRSDNSSSSTPSDADLIHGAHERFLQTLTDGAYVPWKFHPRGASYAPAANASGATIERIMIRKTGAAGNATNGSSVDESYALDLSVNGTVLIQAAGAQGAMHGLTTLAQLFYATDDGAPYTNLAPVSIQDKPKYAHRGLNMDIARNYESPATIMHLLDGMALAKLNRLHLHATDAQSWPLEIPAMPELSAKGAYRPGLAWSAADLEEVQEHARARGIQTIIEIDAPGHTASLAYSRPDLIVAFNQQPWTKYCAEPPCGQVSLQSNATLDFFDKLYADLLPRVKAFSGYFHAGGDEINANVYSLDPLTKSNDTAVLKPLLEAFVTHLHDTIRKQGLRPLVWEELVTPPWSLALPKDDLLVQTWINSTSLDVVTKAGYRALFGDADHWYLDCGFGQFTDPDPATVGTPQAVISDKNGFADYCSPYKNWRHIYAYDPTVNLTQAQQALLEGGEVHMWGELTTAANLDGKVWPRAAAAAEVMWSGPKGEKGVVEDVTRRLADWRERAVGLGFAASVVQVEWCLQNRGVCFQ